MNVLGLPALGSQAEDRIRVDELLGRAGLDGFLLRSPSSLLDLPADSAGQWWFGALAPDLRSVWNTGLPFSMNDGSLWAGKGWSVAVRAGAVVRYGRVTLIFAPEFNHEQNRQFEVIPYPDNGDPPRSHFANFLHPLPQSVDYPLRFGDGAIDEVLPGQSSLSVEVGRVSVGAATENVWWGPGIRNAIVLSNQAAGFPHLFVSTRRPWATGIGKFAGQWILGRLDESKYFDSDPTNDHRTISGLAITLTPSFDPGLTLGIGRVVLATLPEGRSPLAAALDVLRSVGRPNAKSPETPPAVARDQIFTFFGRWVFPKAGFEAYWEWARFEQPASLRDLLTFPTRSEGYTYGVQWAGARPDSSVFRIQIEATNLEPDPSWRFKPPFSTYASQAVTQGFTNRGQILGAAIGPGASSQWLALDRFDRRGWSLGAFLGRVRSEVGAQYSSVVPTPRRNDVLLFWGMRGSVRRWGWTFGSELSEGVRINYLFQTYPLDPATGKGEGVDVGNTSLTVTLARARRK